MLAEGQEHTENKSQDKRTGLRVKGQEGEGRKEALRPI